MDPTKSIQNFRAWLIEMLSRLKQQAKKTLMPYMLNRNLPATDASPIILINRFFIEKGKEERFLAQWKVLAESMALQPGFVSAQMHQNLSKKRQWVNYAVWKDASSFRAAIVTDTFQRLSINLPAFAIPSFYQLQDLSEKDRETQQTPA